MEKNMPTIDDLCESLKRHKEEKIADQIKQAMITNNIFNPLLENSLPKEMKENHKIEDKVKTVDIYGNTIEGKVIEITPDYVCFEGVNKIKIKTEWNKIKKIENLMQ